MAQGWKLISEFRSSLGQNSCSWKRNEVIQSYDVDFESAVWPGIYINSSIFPKNIAHLV